ncbi:hypothetical protein [Nocardia gipuzkoensis]
MSETTEYVTTKGRTIRKGQLYRDSRTDNVRTLQVVKINDPYTTERPDERQIDCIVIRQMHGQPPITTEPMRPTSTTAKRLTGRDFVLIEDA